MNKVNEEWFDDYPPLDRNGDPVYKNPLDSMPIANGSNRYAPPEKIERMLELEENPRPEEEIAEDWFENDTYASRHQSTPDYEKGAEEVVTMHEQMYRIAMSRHNPFSINSGGSENCHSDLDCNIGGSEEAHK